MGRNSRRIERVVAAEKNPVTCLKTVVTSAHGSSNRCDGQSQALHAHSRCSLYDGLRSVRPRTGWYVWRRLPASILLSSVTLSSCRRALRRRAICKDFSEPSACAPGGRGTQRYRNGQRAWKHAPIYSCSGTRRSPRARAMAYCQASLGSTSWLMVAVCWSGVDPCSGGQCLAGAQQKTELLPRIYAVQPNWSMAFIDPPLTRLPRHRNVFFRTHGAKRNWPWLDG
jgi:hypothetical protein